MNIPVKCKCGKILLIPSQYAGERGRCPKCTRLLFIPEYQEDTSWVDNKDTIAVSCKPNATTGELEIEEIIHQNTSLSIHWNKLKKIVWILYTIISTIALIYLLFYYRTYKQSIYEETKILEQKKINAEKLQEQKLQELNSFIETQITALQQFNKEKRIEDIVSYLTPYIIKSMYQKFCIEDLNNTEIPPSLQRLIFTYENLRIQHTEPKQVMQYSISNDDIEKYQKLYDEFLPKFKGFMYNRNYDEAQRQLELIWKPLNTLDISDDESLIITLRRHLKEIQATRTLFNLAIEGANKAKGLQKAVFTRDGQVILGQLKECNAGVFYIQLANHVMAQVSIRALRAEEIVYFAMNTETMQNVNFYAGIFYFYEKNYNLAQQVFTEALKYGTNIEEIRNYIQITQQSAVSERN